MTDKQLEFAAREYCTLMGLNPESMVGHSPEPNPDGSVNAVLLFSPRWQTLKAEIRHTWVVQEAINRAMLKN